MHYEKWQKLCEAKKEDSFTSYDAKKEHFKKKLLSLKLDVHSWVLEFGRALFEKRFI